MESSVLGAFDRPTMSSRDLDTDTGGNLGRDVTALYDNGQSLHLPFGRGKDEAEFALGAFKLPFAESFYDRGCQWDGTVAGAGFRPP
jgi:hypothetical protein